MTLVITGHWEGLDNLGERALEEERPRAERALRAVGMFATNEIKKTLTGKRSGRSYPASKRGPAHVASAPGEPPAVLFGNLRNSVGYGEPLWATDFGSITMEVGVGLGQAPGLTIDPERAYARRLELGGVHAVPENVVVQVEAGVWRMVKAGTVIRIAPRPYIAPTFERIGPDIDRMLADA